MQKCYVPQVNHITSCACASILLTVAGKEIERIEIEVQVGEKAAEKLIKQINLSQEEEEEIAQGKPALIKLKKILDPTMKRSSSSSSSSSAKLFSSSTPS